MASWQTGRMRRALVPVLGITLFLAFTGLASAAGSQNWYPDSTGTVYDTAYRGSEPSAWHTTVDDGGFQIWRADEVATTDVDFGSGDWTFHLLLREAFIGTFDLDVGTHDPTTDDYTWVATATVASDGDSKIYEGSIPLETASSFGVSQGDYLAFRLFNTEDEATGNATVDRLRVVDLETGTVETRFTSPESDPGYPAPELPAIALASVGLLALAARRVWLRRAP